MRKRGKLIVFEGADGAGTTTQTAKLRDRILSDDPTQKVFIGHTPSSRPVGAFTRQLVKDFRVLDWRVMQSLFYADMVDYTQNVIMPALDNGYHFICDRYYPSTLVYQASGVVPYDDQEAVERMQKMYHEMFGVCMLEDDCDFAYPLMDPDITIYLDLSRGALKKRVDDRREPLDAYEGDERRGRLLALYREWLEGEFDTSDKVCLDGERGIEEIADDCYEIYQDLQGEW